MQNALKAYRGLSRFAGAAPRIRAMLRPPGPRLFFVHTPKCGGKYVEHALGWRLRLSPPLRWRDMRGHLTFREYEDMLRSHGERIADYLTFSVVRNPWDWHLSFYTYVRHDAGGRRSGHPGLHEAFSRRSFRDHILGLDEFAASYPADHPLNRNLVDWVLGADGTIAVDRLLRQETLVDDLRCLTSALGLPAKIDPNRRINASRSARERDYRARYDDVMAEIVARRHRRDQELLGYRFA